MIKKSAKEILRERVKILNPLDFHKGNCLVCNEPLHRNNYKELKEAEVTVGRILPVKMKLQAKVDTGFTSQLVYFHKECRAKRLKLQYGRKA